MTEPRSQQVTALLFVMCASGATHSGSSDAPALVVSPPFRRMFTCTEHYAGQFASMGDALGTDCHIQELAAVEGRTWLRSYRTSGATNEDWYGWRQDVLAPVDGKVVKVNTNPTVNTPGVMGTGVASFVILAKADETMVLVAHLDSVLVKAGDRVTAGGVLGKVGNNGQSRHPHIHLGAWNGSTPLQIRFDQIALANAYLRP